ncbi:hypothetical protein YPPY71_1996 [Yersinia pestis PY-71]|nr:hypothetical protein YPPY71_1996 [Yersinia pestis PY-71]
MPSFALVKTTGNFILSGETGHMVSGAALTSVRPKTAWPQVDENDSCVPGFV